MLSIKFERFDKLFKFLPKSKIKAGERLEEGKYKFFTSSNTQSKYLNEFIYDTESLIIGTGGKASIHYCDEKFATSTDCFVVEKQYSEIDVKYVYYFLKTNFQILENGFKGAALKHISKKYISNIRIPLLSLDNQRKIAQYLSQIERIKEDRKYSITLLESFLKNIFLEMIIFNEDTENWKKPKIEQLLLNQKNSIRTGPFGSDLLHSEFTKNGDVAVLGIDNVVQNKFTWDEKRYISFEKYQKLERYKINPNDVLITIMGTVGRTAVVPEDIPIAINTKHLVALSLNQELANPEFIAYSLRENPQILSQLKKKAKGAIMDGLNLTIIKNLKIILPPIQLQDKFSMIFKKIENTKITYEDSLIELNKLFESVSQKAFSGKLNLKKIEINQISKIEELSKVVKQGVIQQPKKEKKSLLHNLLNIGLIVGGTALTAYTAKKIFDNYNKDVADNIVKNGKDIIDFKNNIIEYDKDIQLQFNDRFLKSFIKVFQEKEIVLNNRLLEELYKVDFEKKPTFSDIKDALVNLLEKKEVEQFKHKDKTTNGFEENVAFRVMK